MQDLRQAGRNQAGVRLGGDDGCTSWLGDPVPAGFGVDASASGPSFAVYEGGEWADVGSFEERTSAILPEPMSWLSVPTESMQYMWPDETGETLRTIADLEAGRAGADKWREKLAGRMQDLMTGGVAEIIRIADWKPHLFGRVEIDGEFQASLLSTDGRDVTYGMAAEENRLMSIVTMSAILGISRFGFPPVMDGIVGLSHPRLAALAGNIHKILPDGQAILLVTDTGYMSTAATEKGTSKSFHDSLAVPRTEYTIKWSKGASSIHGME